MKTRPGQAALAALAWTILGCVFALPDLSTGTDRRCALLLSLTLWWSWGIVTPLIIWADRHIPVSSKQLALRVVAHFLPSLLITSVYAYVLWAIRAAFGINEWNGLLSVRGMFLWNWLIYWMIVGAWQAYRYYDRYIASELRLERLEKSFSEARLNALRMQLDPHFLFNALNTISSQVERDPKLARGMIEHLGNLLRLSLESKDRQQVPLAEEMARFWNTIWRSRKIRFRDHLRIETQIAPEVKYASVPLPFCSATGGECNPRHGISRRASGGTVAVSAQRAGNRLDIRVLDDGVGLPAGWTLENSGGVGLSVTRQRVAGLYPDGEACFAVNRRATGGTEGSGKYRNTSCDGTERMPMPLTASEGLCVLVADDEAPARQRIVDLLRDSQVGAILEASDGLSAVEIIQNRKPDLVFLDVQMPERNGLEVIAEVGPERMPLTVFVTAYDEHAIRAFEANALDYLLKPFSDDRFEMTMARAGIRMDERSLREFGQRILRMVSAAPTGNLPLDRLVVKSGGSTRFVRVADIDWIEAGRGVCEPARWRKGTVVPGRAERACREAGSGSFCPRASLGDHKYRKHPAPGADLSWRI